MAAGMVILFTWNIFSWMVLPFHIGNLKNMPSPVPLHLTESGVYHYPGFPAGNTPQQWKQVEDKLEMGPRITLMVYRVGPTSLFEPKLFLMTLLLDLLAVVTILSILEKLAVRSASNIIATSLLTGLLVCFTKDFPQMIWYMFPWSYTFTEAADVLVSFGLLGIFIAHHSSQTRSA